MLLFLQMCNLLNTQGDFGDWCFSGSSKENIHRNSQYVSSIIVNNYKGEMLLKILLIISCLYAK